MDNEIYVEPIPRKDKYTIRMDVKFDKKMTQEEAEKRIFDALRNVGIKAHCGGIS